jgi:hypothetical protein
MATDRTNIELMWQKRLLAWHNHYLYTSMADLKAEFQRTVFLRQEDVLREHGGGLPTMRLIHLLEKAIWRTYCRLNENEALRSHC